MAQYQTFPGVRGGSDSFAKLKALHLPDMTGKSFLDAGCNEGFFCGAALMGGASQAVGLDLDAKALERARLRFPDAEFRHQSWDAPIEGSFDVILLASAIHYAKDQPALIAKLVSLLTPGGVLVLEMGVANEPGDDYVTVRRTVGDERKFATPGALRKVLADYAYRVIGPSVQQSGDQIPRQVIHVRRFQPTILFFDQPSMSGKSTMVRLLTQGRDRSRKDVKTVGLDGIFARTLAAIKAKHPGHDAIIDVIVDFKASDSERADLLMKMIAARGLIGDFLLYLEDFFGLAKANLVIWDGYIPEEARAAVRNHFAARGWSLWDTAPRSSRQFARMNNDAVLEALNHMPVIVAPEPQSRKAAKAPAQEDTPAAVEAGPLAGQLRRCRVTEEGLRLVGWACDLDNLSVAEKLVVELDGKPLPPQSIKRNPRFAPPEPEDWQAEIVLGFRIDIPYADLGGADAFLQRAAASKQGLEGLRAGVVSKGGKTRWLERAPTFQIQWD